jgi:signal recognition particle receptor subunit beta
VIQLNKRDLPDAISVAMLKRNLNLPNSDIDGMGFPLVYEAIAGNEVNPEGVKECMLDLLQKILFQKLIPNQ